MGHTTAVKIMRVAETFGDKFAFSVNLGTSILYELAAPSTTPEVGDEVERRTEAGEPVALAEIRPGSSGP